MDIEIFRRASKRMTEQRAPHDGVALDELIARTELHMKQLRADLTAFANSRDISHQASPRDPHCIPRQPEDAS